MASFEDIVGSVEAAESAKREAQAAIRELQKKITQGEAGTGDALTDGVIAIHGADVLNPRYLEAYRELDESLKGKVGEPVLVVHFWHGHGQGCTGFGGKPSYEEHRTMELGILAGDSLTFNLQEKKCFLPTQKHSKHGARPRGRDYTTEDGSILVSAVQIGLGLRNLVHGDTITEIPENPNHQIFDLFFHGLGDSNRHDQLLILVGTERIKQLVERLFLFEIEPTLRRMMIDLGETPIMTQFTTNNMEKERAALAERKANILSELEKARRQTEEGAGRSDTLTQELADIEAEEAKLDSVEA